MRRGSALVAAVVLAATVAACGSSGSSGSGGGGGGSNAPIVIGTSISKTGVYAASADFALKGYEYWVDEINANGGLLGRKVKLKVMDDKSDPGAAVQLYTKLISQDRVDIIVGPYSSGISQAVAPLAEKFKMPMIDPEASASNIFTDTKYNLQGLKPAKDYLTQVPDVAAQTAPGAKTMALFVSNTPATTAMCSALKAAAAAKGIKTVFEKQYPNDASGFSSLVLAAKKSNPDIVVGCTYVPDSIGLVKEMGRQGLTPKVAGFSIGPAEPTFGESLGKAADGVLGSTSWWPTLDTRGNKEFVAGFKKKYGELPDYHAAQNYGSLTVLGEAVKQAGTIDSAKLNDTLHSITVPTVEGDYKVDASGRQLGFNEYLLQWNGGKSKLVWPPTDAETKPTPLGG